MIHTTKKRHSKESIRLRDTEAVPMNLESSPVRLGHRVWGWEELGKVVRD